MNFNPTLTMMENCYIKFQSANEDLIRRLKNFFELVKAQKESLEDRNEQLLTQFLSEKELGFFWYPSEEEQKEWNEYWVSAPVDFRLSSQMPEPPWGLESMYEAIWNGDYDLLNIICEDGQCYLNFDPNGYPYGGIASLIAMIECFGHKVEGADGGTGYSEYVSPPIWTSSRNKQ